MSRLGRSLPDAFSSNQFSTSIRLGLAVRPLTPFNDSAGNAQENSKAHYIQSADNHYQIARARE
jgi:hypothetical protein